MQIKSSKQVVLSLSGGMDSSTLLLRLLSEGYEVTALSFDYGQKHNIELERAKQLVEYINLTLLDMVPVKHQVIRLDGLSQLLNSTLVIGGAEVPEGHYAEDNMKSTVIPNRNKIFSSIIQAVALSIANSNVDNTCAIAMGIHAGDHTIYPDCRQEFRDADYNAFLLGNWDAEGVHYLTPYLYTDKFGILEDGLRCCEQLGLDFDEVYSCTNTSYKPIQIGNEWYSDMYSASSVERIEAFIKLGRPDPVSYADDFGPVSWETVKKYVSSVLQNYEQKK